MHVDMSALQALTTEKEMSLNALIIYYRRRSSYGLQPHRSVLQNMPVAI
jgi:hypothetical protein